MKEHPFTDEIMEAQLLSKWKELSIKLYDVSTDLDEHLNIYKTRINLYTTNKVVWCKVFPTTLGHSVGSPYFHQTRWTVSKP